MPVPAEIRIEPGEPGDLRDSQHHQALDAFARLQARTAPPRRAIGPAALFVDALRGGPCPARLVVGAGTPADAVYLPPGHLGVRLRRRAGAMSLRWHGDLSR